LLGNELLYTFRLLTYEIISTTEAKAYVKKPRMGKKILPFSQPGLAQGTSGAPLPREEAQD